MSAPRRTIRIVYFGTPGYAVPALEALARDERFEVCLVVTQPDRPSGRGRRPRPSAAKLAAEALGVPVYQPESLRPASFREPLVAVGADLFVVAAYGLIFGRKTLAIPRHGCINLHASILPKYRGASPISAAILAGDDETGVTFMRMDAGMDTGDVLAVTTVPIPSDATTESLTLRLASAGAAAVCDIVGDWVGGGIEARPQAPKGASVARPLVKADGWIDWSQPSATIERRIRAMTPWPRTFTELPNGTMLQVLSGSVVPGVEDAPGTVLADRMTILVACGEGALALERVQTAGGSPMDGRALVSGRKVALGDFLGRRPAPEVPGPLIVRIDDAVSTVGVQ